MRSRWVGRRLLSSARTLLLVLAALAPPAQAEGPAAPAAKVIEGRADGHNRVNIVILGDGYRVEEQATFDQDVEHARNGLFKYTPYRECRKAFNIYSVFQASKDSGADYPKDPNKPMGLGSDNSYIEKDTAFGAIYPFREENQTNEQGERVYDHNNYRALSVDWSRAQAAAAAAVDLVDMVIVLVNADPYGGAAVWGLGICTASARQGSATLAHVVAHETSHVLGYLADEYDYGREAPHEEFFLEFDQPNVSTVSDPALVKWRRWIEAGKLGQPVEGATYYESHAYRPSPNCEMRSRSGSYCPVCVEALVVSIREKVDPIDEVLPDPELVVGADGNEAPSFNVIPVYRVAKDRIVEQPRWHWFFGWVKDRRQVGASTGSHDPGLSIGWYVDEALEPQETGEDFALPPRLLAEGRAEVRLEVDFDPVPVLANPFADGVRNGLLNVLKGAVKRILGQRAADSAPAVGREFMLSRRFWQVEARDRLARIGEPRVLDAAGHALTKKDDWEAQAGETIRVEVDVTSAPDDAPVVLRYVPPGEPRKVTVPMAAGAASLSGEARVYTAWLGPFTASGRLAFKIGLQRSSAAPTQEVYIVVSGDTLFDIARRQRTTWQQLWQANPWIKNPDLIHPGERLRIPR